jgi:CRP-like cAMP-binding protein
MEKHDLGPILAEHPLFKGFEQRYLDLLTGCAKNVVFKVGQFIFREGEPADSFYILRAGQVRLEIPTLNQGRVVIQTLGEGDVLGWSWFVPPYRWHFDARALEQTRALSLDGKCLRKKMEENHDLGYHLLKRFVPVIVDRLQATRLQLLDFYGTYGTYGPSGAASGAGDEK